MGLIQTAKTVVNGVLLDQWKEFFYCDALDKDVLVVKGQKRISNRSSNTQGSDNIISNGSGIAVADGQCMMIVEQGKVVEVCAVPGEYTYDTSTEPSIFAGSLGQSILDTFKTIGKRFTYGGDTGKDQRVYYFNTKELMDNKFGTPNPVPFRVVDSKIGLDVDVSVRCSGVYSYRIADPLLFYTNVCGNVTQAYTRSELETQLKTEFISALAPAFGRLSEMELRPNQLASHNTDIEEAMNIALSKKWGQIRGLQVVSVALNPVTLPDEDAELIKQAQRTAVMRDPTMAAATLVGAQADAMKSAAANEAGAMNGFIGMGLAMKQGGVDAKDLFDMGQKTAPAAAPAKEQAGWKCTCGAVNAGKFCAECGSPKPTEQAGWKCTCGTVNTGKFCANCGAAKPVDDSWKCSCGSVNKGKFCPECGSPKPVPQPEYRCNKCGWEPEDPKNPPKFCPQCGDRFDDTDRK